MAFSSADIGALSEQLPEITLGLTHSEAFLETPVAQAYLDHYKLHFCSRSSPLTHQMGRVSAGDFDIACQTWRQPESLGTVWLVHGYTDHMGLLRHMIQWLLNQGWNVIAFDLPGHGLSSGKRAHIDSFDQYRDVLAELLQSAKDMGGQPWRAIGQSTGAAVLMNYCVSETEPRLLSDFLLLAPLVRSHQWGWQRWVFPVLQRLQDSIPRKFTLGSHDLEFLDFIQKKDPFQPALTPFDWVRAMSHWIDVVNTAAPQTAPVWIVQGDLDTTVDYRYNLPRLARLFPNHTLTWIPGAHHHLMNESLRFRRPVFETVSRWLSCETLPKRK